MREMPVVEAISRAGYSSEKRESECTFLGEKSVRKESIVTVAANIQESITTVFIKRNSTCLLRGRAKLSEMV